jgi:phospholipase C
MSGRGNALDHVVVLMFENRSFDNLLGRLYQPGEVKSFEGVIDKRLSNPIPGWAEHGADRKTVPYGVAKTTDTPNPDSGEEYQHQNTQLFGIIEPVANRCKLAERMAAPYNAPAVGQKPTMDGYVADYISSFAAETGRQPTYDEYAQIMTGFTPEQMPVISGLARGFATFDHWFCEVPSQTFTNRSFFHAASSSGFVVNMPPLDAFPVRNTAETIFERLEAKGLTWKIYCDSPSVLSFTGLIHAARLRTRFADHFVTTDQFLEDARKGELPTYSFIEPNFLQNHNDMHPAFNALFPGLEFDGPSSLLGGEALLKKIYDAVRSSSSPRGSNALNTLFVVTFDENGGTYDHVPPPAVARPDPAAPAGQMGFAFDRSGVRVPAIAVSAWIPERTVVNEEFRHTSVIRTLRERWSLGQPLTKRDAAARDLASILTLDKPRKPEDWPELIAQPAPSFTRAAIPPDAPLKSLPKSLFFGLMTLGKELGQKVPDVSPDDDLKLADSIAMVHDLFGKMWPRLGGR